MPYFLAIIFITLSFPDILPIHQKIKFSLEQGLNPDYKLTFKNERKIQSLNVNVKAMLYSAILPGTGEYSMGHTKRAYLFLGIEVLALGTWNIFNQKGLDTQDEYRAFANKHWSLERWLYDYYKWSNSGNPFHYNFINEESGNYPEIWEDSHHLNFQYNGEYISSNSKRFEVLYDELKIIYLEQSSSEYFENSIQVEKDHHYYENIGKYDHFYAGWEDNDSLYVLVKELGGEYIAMSPYKKLYRKTWNNSNDHYRIASFAISSMVANHFASIFDVLILSKLSNNKIQNLSAKTYFSPLNPYGVGGIKLLFNWD